MLDSVNSFEALFVAFSIVVFLAIVSCLITLAID